MKDWFETLAPREQVMVGAGAIVALILFYWLLIWDPLVQKQGKLDLEIAEQRELALFLEQAGKEAAQYSGGARPSDTGRSLLSIVDSSSKSSGLAEFIKRIQPEGQTSVRLWVEDIPFDKLMNWLAQLQQQNQIVLESGNIDRADRGGTVKVRLNLIRAGGS